MANRFQGQITIWPFPDELDEGLVEALEEAEIDIEAVAELLRGQGTEIPGGRAVYAGSDEYELVVDDRKGRVLTARDFEAADGARQYANSKLVPVLIERELAFVAEDDGDSSGYEPLGLAWHPGLPAPVSVLFDQQGGLALTADEFAQLKARATGPRGLVDPYQLAEGLVEHFEGDPRHWYPGQAAAVELLPPDEVKIAGPRSRTSPLGI